MVLSDMYLQFTQTVFQRYLVNYILLYLGKVHSTMNRLLLVESDLGGEKPSKSDRVWVYVRQDKTDSQRLKIAYLFPIVKC